MPVQRPYTLLFFICLLLTLLGGIVINAPYHNFQDYLAQGDHGRDLYAAQSVLRGQMPYRDFWWVYGPLMPYYYAAFFKIFGVHIPSVLLGKIVVNVLGGLFFFLALAEIFAPAAALTGALWLMAFHKDFFFTYNHAGGIAMMLGAVWMHAAYLRSRQEKYAWGALAFVFVLGLIKINFGVTTLLMTILTVAAGDFWGPAAPGQARAGEFLRKKLFYTAALLLLPLIWLGIYSFFLRGLTVTEIRQCLPYLGGDEPYNHFGPLQTLPILVQNIHHSITAGWPNAAMCLLVLMALTQTGYILVNRNTDPAYRRLLLLLLGYGALFYTLNLHEFIKSGVFYRMFWSQPFSMLLTFTVLAAAAGSLPRWVRAALWSTLLVLVAVGVSTITLQINAFKDGQHFLGSDRGGVYIRNDRAWIQTVVLTTKQLGIAFKEHELFFALPYDCLYYYLTGKPSPTRQLILFDHINIPPEQEQKIIAELEAKPIAGVLVSSRQSAREPGLGTLGVTYCPFIAQYINTNFTPAAKIGDWVNEPGWAWNHGTLILKRK